MATTKEKKPTNVVIGPVRLSYADLWKPRAMEEGQEKKYGSVILIPKKDKKAIATVKKAIAAADVLGKEKFGKKWNPLSKNFKECLHDGDVDKPEAEEYEGMMYLSAKNKNRPNMIYRNGNAITEMDSDEMYSGVWAFVDLNFFPYSNVSVGISASLNNLMKDRDDEPFSGQQSAGEAFKDMIESEGEEEEDEKEEEDEEDFM